MKLKIMKDPEINMKINLLTRDMYYTIQMYSVFMIIYNIFTSREHRTSHHAPTLHASHLTSQKCCHLTGLNIGQPSAYSKTRLNRLNLYTVRGNVSYCTFCKLSGEGILWISFRFSCNLRHFFLLAICLSRPPALEKGSCPHTPHQ